MRESKQVGAHNSLTIGASMDEQTTLGQQADKVAQAKTTPLTSIPTKKGKEPAEPPRNSTNPQKKNVTECSITHITSFVVAESTLSQSGLGVMTYDLFRW